MKKGSSQHKTLAAMPKEEYAKLLDSVFESAIDGIFVIDEKGVIQMLNQAAAKLFSYDEDDLIGKNISLLMGEEHAGSHDGYINRYLKTGEAKIIGIGREVEGKTKAGDMFPFRLSVGELNLPDKTLFTGIVHDRSAEHAYERQLKELAESLEFKVDERTKELQRILARLEGEVEDRKKAEAVAEDSREAALRALERERDLGELKSRFVSLASHEFRTPLSTILSSVELIRRYTEGSQQDRRERHIQRIRKSVIHLTDILNDFLSLGRMEEGRLKPQFVELNLNDTVREFVDYISPTLKPGQRVVVSGDVGSGLFTTDVKFLRNILNNLLSNASKYSDLNSEIVLMLDVLDTDWLRVRVRDHGIGIPAEEQEHLFDRFFRARNAENIQGTGLGLHIVKRYLQLLGGSISFESTAGQGTTFEVMIPPSSQSITENIINE